MDGSPISSEGHKLSPQKRKRDTGEASELEIDVSLPEPPSKKALRKAKKRSNAPQTSGDDSVTAKSAANADVASARPISNVNARAEYSIWIGNLPFSLDKQMLTSFFTTNSTPAIAPASMTRIHLPPPSNPGAGRGPASLKPVNRGFAYVDFADQASFLAAVALTETPLAGRRVLIKDAKNFEGRPAEHGKINGHKGQDANVAADGRNHKKPTRRVFVGNLGFDVTKEDLEKHFSPCGTVEDIHMATFEDSGKCKGFAWVRFTDEGSAASAVQGWVKTVNKDDFADKEEEGEKEDGLENTMDGEEYITTKNGQRKPRKKRMVKWFVNRMFGRDLRCEFAEDESTRYRKRFGKEARGIATNQHESVPEGETDGQATVASKQKKHAVGRKDLFDIHPGAPNDPLKRRGKRELSRRHDDTPRSGKTRGNAADASYRTGALTASTGSKVTFD